MFEALGRSQAESLVKLRGGGAWLQPRRVTNLVMPVCRVMAAVVGAWLIYKLRVDLGLPSSAVLAFAGVVAFAALPGLAIGLGASKLLGNLFAYLAIQTDRHLRVGGSAATVNGIAGLSLQSCRLRLINAFSHDIIIRVYGSHASRGAFKEAVQQLKISVLARLDAEGIQIPFPSQVEINTSAHR